MLMSSCLPLSFNPTTGAVFLTSLQHTPSRHHHQHSYRSTALFPSLSPIPVQGYTFHPQPHTPTPTPPYPLVAQKRQGGWETFGADFLNTVLNANEALLATFTNQVFIYSSFQMVSDIQMMHRFFLFLFLPIFLISSSGRFPGFVSLWSW